MSDYEQKIGTLIPVEGELHAVARKLLEELGVKPSSDNSEVMEQLSDHGYRKFVIHNGKVYRVEVEKDDPYGDIFEAVKYEDGSIGFVLRYYNGGCSFSEAIESALEGF